MNVFLQHVGEPGNRDIAFTVTRERTIDEMMRSLPQNASEREWFESALDTAFPEGRFNCWGVPPGAEPRFRDTRIGDLVLMFPRSGVNGALEQLGVVRALCPRPAWDASRVLWPDTPDARLFPHIFFFQTEVGYRGWAEFLEDVGYAPNWYPRGMYRRIDSMRFSKWGGPEAYLDFLRSHGFR